MKKFQFGLESVLNYKNMVLDQVVIEHGKILAEIIKKQNEIINLELEYKNSGDDFLKKQMIGMSSEQANRYRIFLDSLNYKIDIKKVEVQQLLKIEKKKQQKVILAKQETATFEKLKEKQYEEYKIIESKKLEIDIEEFLVRKISFLR